MLTDILLQAGASYKTLDPDEILFKEGTLCNFYYQLIDGNIKWVNISEDGKEFIQYVVNENECVGEVALFDDHLYAATAIAMTPCTVLRLHKDSFMKLLPLYPELHLFISKLMAQRLRFKLVSSKELAMYPPEHRIVSLLDYMMKNSRKNICSKCRKVGLTRQQIADMTGLRVETVIRAMRHLHDIGKLTIEKGKVYCGNLI
ncbi:MAG: Crp/Fnr family transcriptional regulator [Chitinophagaceae bacterium]|nr:Crp/Fnr family transcriptional regulator [Chitinophagaceae bacterium]